MLRLFGANPATPFVRWMYETTDPLIFPFRGMFPHPVLSGGFVIEFSTLFALLVYTFLGYLMIEVIAFLERQSRIIYRRTEDL